MAANAGVFRFCIGVVRPCGSCPAPAAGTAQRPNGSCLAAKRFLPGRTVPAKRFLPGRSGSCAAPARFLPGSCPVPARFLRPPKRFLPNGVSKSRIVSFLYHIISSLQTRRTTRREQVARLSQDRGAGLSPCARNTIREAISRDTSSSQHAGQRTRCPKEPHAQRSWHLQRSLPAQSEDLQTEVWLAESLRRRGARPTPRSHWLLDELLTILDFEPLRPGRNRLAGTVWRGRNRPAGQEPFGREAGTVRPRGRNRPAVGQEPGRSRAGTARPHHSDTEPENARICRHFNILARFLQR